jgi:hypothetical protein
VPSERRRTETLAARRWLEQAILAAGFVAAVASGVIAYRISGPYGEREAHDSRVKRVVDPATGRLQLLVYDTDGDGRFDTWSYMDGDRLLRMEIDTNHDGVIDRWEIYRADGTLERVGRSSRNDGHPDVWREVKSPVTAERTAQNTAR